ncbi:MAG: alpha-glucoside transport system ATP-binding protein [Verrucomicrobiota bacterium]|jgi:multiple sugar transport system ATP-binding protein
MANITLHNISVGRLTDCSLEIQDREFVVLAGPPGSGSSTILRVIAGLEDPSRGDIFLGERRMNDVPPKDREVALVSRDYAPYPRMSVYDNLAFAIRPGKFSEAETKKRVLAAAEVLGLQEILERMPATLGAEERQRLALARAIARQPKIILFDEPFASLDREARVRGRAEIRKLHQRLPATTIIYATTDPVEALVMGERLVVLDQGVVHQEGDPAAVYDAPANLFVARFIGYPPMNLIHGTLKQDRDSLVFSEQGDGTIKVRLPVSEFPNAKDFVGQPIVFGIRPEDITVAATETERSPTSFRALVEMVEPTGAEANLYLQTGAHALICRSRRGTDKGNAGHRLQFEINLKEARLFDPASGRLIVKEG